MKCLNLYLSPKMSKVMNTWDHERRRSVDMGGLEINEDNIMTDLK
jgi:hypothetical protein